MRLCGQDLADEGPHGLGDVGAAFAGPFDGGDRGGADDRGVGAGCADGFDVLPVPTPKPTAIGESVCARRAVTVSASAAWPVAGAVPLRP